MSGNFQYPEGLPLWKRALDLALIALSLPLTLPVGILIALVIKCVSRGPVFFRQERIGYLGRKFLCYKFRTMHTGAQAAGHEQHLAHLISSDAPMEKLDARGDKRIIPGGRKLRAWGLDELPQLFNVLRSEMSLVGPRPCLPYECAKFLPWQKKRFRAVPGLTGLWQVSGKNRTTFSEMIRLDIQYARTKSLWLDLKIIFKTVPALVAQSRDIAGRKNLTADTRETETVEAAMRPRPVHH
ncbi:MAG TPA: sugar transferase [Verrucomicrobiae bacterium]|nr:sugar transferase [Verrucomicrobiae bacterium]